MSPLNREHPLAYRINDLHNHAPWGRSKSYELVRSGKLPARKLDGITFILHADLVKFLNHTEVAVQGDAGAA